MRPRMQPLVGHGKDRATAGTRQNLGGLARDRQIVGANIVPKRMVGTLIVSGGPLQNVQGPVYEGIAALTGERTNGQESIGSHVASNPQSCRKPATSPQEGFLATVTGRPPSYWPRRRIQAPYPEIFAGRDYAEGSSKLLNGKQAERVAGENTRAIA